MSLITQVGSTDPNLPWVIGALPLAIGIDLAVGSIPGRSIGARALRWSINLVEPVVRRFMGQLGGGRGAELFGDVLLSSMVVGSWASSVWLTVDLSDMVGGPLSLLSRTTLILAGLIIRPTGDRISQVAESSHSAEARDRLAAISRGYVAGLAELGVDRVCVSLVGEQIITAIVAPLCWLAAGGPAGLWAYLAIRTLRDVQLQQDRADGLMSRVSIYLADLAELIPAILSWILIALAALPLRLNSGEAIRTGWAESRKGPRSNPSWTQAALAGALGLRLRVGQVFTADHCHSSRMVGPIPGDPKLGMVSLSVRIMQVVTLLTAGSVVVLSLLI